MTNYHQERDGGYAEGNTNASVVMNTLRELCWQEKQQSSSYDAVYDGADCMMMFPVSNNNETLLWLKWFSVCLRQCVFNLINNCCEVLTVQ